MNQKLAMIVLSMTTLLQAAGGSAGLVRGTVEKVDVAARAIAVKTEDGARLTVKVAESAVSNGFQDAKAGWRSVEKGAQVVVYGTRSGANIAATEIDHLGQNGLKAMRATILEVDKAGNYVKAATINGATEVYHLTGEAARVLAKELSEGKQATIYCTEETGRKIAHLFEAR